MTTKSSGGESRGQRRADRPGRSILVVALSAMTLVLASTAALARGPESVAAIAEPLFAAVVNISTSQTVKGAQGVPLPKVPKGSPFEEFFDDFFRKDGKPGGSDRRVSSLGSGFVIDASGLVVTNNHVIEGADEITVIFTDGSKLKVDKVLGRDSKTDLALLKVTPKKPLAAVRFGRSDPLRVGDWVLAIGNPFGLGGTLTVGVVSAKQRDINSGPYDDYIQTDAAINKGNSGGPLFNMSGEVIGVNTAIISPTGGSIGIGFAVPSDAAVTVIDQLRQFGETRRGWLGVRIQSITDELAESLSLKDTRGALISGVTKDGPAEKAGLQREDVVVRFDGKDVLNSRTLPRLVAQTAIDQTVDIEVMRKGERRKLKITVGRLDEADKKVAAKPSDKPAASADTVSLVGLKMSPLTDELRRKFNIDKKVKGVVITEVDADSPALKKGMKPGDIIVEVTQEAVSTPDDVVQRANAVRKAGRKVVLLGVQDPKGEFRFVGLPLE
jgi:serine protease Do